MKHTDSNIRARLASLRVKLPTNTQLALDGTAKRLLSAGFDLPCTGEQASHFLLNKANDGAKISTLRNYCSLIIKWHKMAGYTEAAVDITMKAQPVINGIMRERIEAGEREHRESATPLLLEDALKIDAYLCRAIRANENNTLPIQDLCLFRLLWWSGCRESEIVSLKRWQISFNEQPRGININWSITKTSQLGTGTSRFIPALPHADPYGALMDWIDLYWPHSKTNNEDGYIFARKSPNGEWKKKPMHPNSVPTWLRNIAKKAGVHYWKNLSGHSARHGLTMTMSDRVSLRELMDYFKWKRAETAIRYMTNKGASAAVTAALSDACSTTSTHSAISKM